MKSQEIPPQGGESEPQIPQQLNIDFEGAAKEAAIRAAIEARAKEIRKNENVTMPYARVIASQQLTTERLDEKAKQKKKPN